MKLFIWILYNPSEGLTIPLTGAVGYWTNRSFVSASEAWEPNIDPRAEMKSSGRNLWNKTIDLRVPLNSSQLIWYVYLQGRAILCSRWMQVQVRWLRTHAEHGVESATRGGRRLYTDARTRVWLARLQLRRHALRRRYDGRFYTDDRSKFVINVIIKMKLIQILRILFLR